MSSCSNCGAPIAFSGPTATCGFCDVVNEAPAKEIRVAVPVQVIHQTVHVEATDPDAAILVCPHCRRRLATVRVKDVELNGCGACGGIWVDNASAQNLVKAPDAVFEDLATRCAAGARNRSKRAAAPVCARCRVPLDPAKNGQLELDVCTLHGTWFDAFELAGLIRSLLAKRAPSAEARPATVVCVGCSTSIPAASANISGRGSMCDACWRREQERQLEGGSDPSLFAAREGVTGTGQFADPSGSRRAAAAADLAAGGLAVVGALFDAQRISRRA
ncbi:MAG: zf-TFIIB domain-containing protein [Polyangiaceae bacterium]